MSEIFPLVRLLQSYANLRNPVIITLEQLIKFVAYSSRLKDDILLVQPSSYPASQTPILSPAIQLFLSDACSIPLDAVPHFWAALANVSWSTNLELSSKDGVFEAAYAAFGHTRGICTSVVKPIPRIHVHFIWPTAFQTIAPPSHYCLNTSCRRYQQMIKKCEVRKAVLFTAGRGAIPVHSLHLYCECEYHSALIYAGSKS
jgi:hypothetical protein